MKNRTEILTIMVIDIHSYTHTTTKVMRHELFELQDVFDRLALPVFADFSGTVLKKMGDAFIITFKSATDAVLCGIELQKAFHFYNKTENPKHPINIKVAIHTGEVIHRENDMYGDAMNAAARIEKFAKKNWVVFSESTFLAMNKAEIPYIFMGAHRMKGLRYPVKLFRVKTNYDDWHEKKHIQKKKTKSLVKFVIYIVLFFLILLFLLFYFMRIVY